jgi:MFS family permease
VSTAANVGGAVLGGVLSDRLRRRRLFAGGAAVLIAGAIATFALAPSWPIVLAAYVVYGCGSGCYYAVDIALVAQVLPSTRDVGKDLGVINLANTLPQALAPLLALGALGGAPTDYRTLFLIAAGLAAAGALAVAPIKGVR